MNAHINHDLPLALTAVSIEPDRSRRYQDHAAVNQVLRAATDPVKKRICEVYAPALSLVDYALNRLEEDLTSFSFARARQSAWVTAVALANARDDEERAAIRTRLDEQAGILGQLICGLVPHQPWLVGALQHLESISPWWIYITLHHQGHAAVLPAAGQIDDQMVVVVHTRAEITARLEEVVQRYDAARSKLALYPAIYLLLMRRLTAAETHRSLEDPAWVAQVELHYASQYFQALSAFEDGRMRAVPRCWAIAFQAATQGHATILQHLLLAFNARLNHDLPLALLHAGVTADTDRRRRDLERLHAVHEVERRSLHELLARRYGRIFSVAGIIAGSIEEMAVDFNYAHARERAWENALALSRAQSEDERRAMMRETDARASVLAQKILLKGLPGRHSHGGLLWHIENALDEQWSEWLREQAPR